MANRKPDRQLTGFWHGFLSTFDLFGVVDGDRNEDREKLELLVKRSPSENFRSDWKNIEGDFRTTMVRMKKKHSF